MADTKERRERKGRDAEKRQQERECEEEITEKRREKREDEQAEEGLAAECERTAGALRMSGVTVQFGDGEPPGSSG